MWELVAKATANNELGIAAKVAPRSPFEDQRKDRIICVYTADFNDKADVGRVLQRLRELRLVETKGRLVYYKPGESHPQQLPWMSDEGKQLTDAVRCVHVHWYFVRKHMGGQRLDLQLQGHLLMAGESRGIWFEPCVIPISSGNRCYGGYCNKYRAQGRGMEK